MGDPKEPARDPIASLLEFSADCEQTAEEAEQQLRAAGVDVDGFVTRLKERLAKQADEVRLGWLTAARARISKSRATAIPYNYKTMSRASLIVALKERQSSPAQAQAFFHKLDEVTDEDLRTLLMDLDDLDADDKDPT
jgi:hypothetical protein